jgi:uncharacterized SAM-binding protein YcdF (DUF218 family)
MHQAASYFFNLLLSPFNWIIILLVGAYFLRRSQLRKMCRIVALCILLLFGNSWLLDWYAKKWQPLPVVIAPGVEFSCGIVLGGFASPDNNEKGYFNSSADRFIQVVKLYKRGAIKHILMCGGNGKKDIKGFREADFVKGELLAFGVPDSAIFVEDRSNNTADNAAYAKKILDSIQLKPPYLLVTSAHHIPRASLLFENAGIPVVPFPCNYVAGKETFTLSSLLPRLSVLTGWEPYLKETAGYLWYKSKITKH